MFPERIQQIQFGTGRSTGSFSVHHLTPYEHSNGQRPRHRSEKRRESILLPAGRKHRKIHPVPKKTATIGGAPAWIGSEGFSGDTSGDFRGSHLRRNRNIKSEAPHGTDDIHREILMNFTLRVQVAPVTALFSFSKSNL